MATNLALDPELLNEVLEVSGEQTKKAAVTRALQEFIAHPEQDLALVPGHECRLLKGVEA